MKQDNLIQDRTFDFAIEIIALYKKLQEQKEFVLSKQVLRSGTSIGANVEEAIGGHSRKDFIAKLVIANKEARETRYWLRLLQRSQLVKMDYSKQINEAEQILNILNAIIKTSRQNSGILGFLLFSVFPISLYILTHQNS
ncbi:MAG: four helix bundle protein [Bacteroidota bacterium]